MYIYKFACGALEILDSKPDYLSKIKIETKMRKIDYEKSVDDEKLPVTFKYASKKDRAIQEVFLVGTFTSWKDKVAMTKNDEQFVAIVDLPEGEHQYKFVVDGNWEHDPNQVTFRTNNQDLSDKPSCGFLI